MWITLSNRLRNRNNGENTPFESNRRYLKHSQPPYYTGYSEQTRLQPPKPINSNNTANQGEFYPQPHLMIPPFEPINGTRGANHERFDEPNADNPTLPTNDQPQILPHLPDPYQYAGPTNYVYRPILPPPNLPQPQPLQPQPPNINSYQTRYPLANSVFHPESSDRFTGILNHFKQFVPTSSSVVITSSSHSEYAHRPSNVVSFDRDFLKFFESGDVPGSWICFDFGRSRVIPTHYQIVSNLSIQNHPKSWVIEGSENADNWTILDRQSNCNLLNGSYFSHIFEIRNVEQLRFRFIRMRQTGLNWGNNNKLNIDSFELYGSLIR